MSSNNSEIRSLYLFAITFFLLLIYAARNILGTMSFYALRFNLTDSETFHKFVSFNTDFSLFENLIFWLNISCLLLTLIALGVTIYRIYRFYRVK